MTTRPKRARKKGAPESAAEDPGDLQWLAPFSPVILRARVPAEHVEAIRAAAGKILRDDRLAIERQEGSPVLRNTHQRVELLDDIMGDGGPGRFLEGLCVRYIRHVAPTVTGHDPSRARAAIKAAWVNNQVANDFVPLHQHDGTLSGVVYLRVPERMDEEEDEAGHLQFFDGRPIDPYLVRHKLSVKPVEGDVYVFPSWLQHMVYPFRKTGERWAMSFNAVVYEPQGADAEADAGRRE